MLSIESFVVNKFDDWKYYGNPATDIRVDCPFCENRGAGLDSGSHLYISLDKQTTHCFRCGYSAGWLKFVMDSTGLNYYQALGELYHPAKIRSDLKDSVEKKLLQLDTGKIIIKYGLPEDYTPLSVAEYKDPLYTRCVGYLRKRGFSPGAWFHYNLGYAHSIGYRVIIPIEYGYWQGRRIFKWDEPKYLNPDIPSREVLFNSRALNEYNEVVICEGAFSAMAVGYNAIALISKEATKEKMDRLLKSQIESFIIALEPGAYSSMSKLAERLHRNGCKVVLWKYSTGDPADPDGQFEVVEYGLKSKLLFSLG